MMPMKSPDSTIESESGLFDFPHRPLQPQRQAQRRSLRNRRYAGVALWLVTMAKGTKTTIVFFHRETKAAKHWENL
jgi:hypothetical protein